MKKLIPVLAAAVLAACTQIDTGNVGVESSMGQFKKEVLTPGVYFTAFKRVTEVSTKEILLPHGGHASTDQRQDHADRP